MKGSKGKNFLIVGVGNPFRGDDSVGILVARFLKRCFGERVKIIGVGFSLDELIQTWGNYDLVILIDAVKSKESPGKIYRLKFGVDEISARLEFFSTHSIGLIEHIEIAKALGKLPRELIIYGIVGKDFDIGGAISREARASCKEVIKQILSELGG